jgi:hypothetical protein
VHLRLPSFDRGFTSFLWAFGFGLFLWLGMLAIGVEGGTAFIFSVLAACAIFLVVRLYGEDEVRRVRP